MGRRYTCITHLVPVLHVGDMCIIGGLHMYFVVYCHFYMVGPYSK